VCRLDVTSGKLEGVDVIIDSDEDLMTRRVGPHPSR